jgi:hypothetical protein
VIRRQVDDSVGCRDSTKFNFCSHPAAEVLSDWARMQSNWSMWPPSISNQIEITDHKNYRVLIWARPVYVEGILILQAQPV